jgi:uncharacterized tellurite resistance protein B-like protein
MGETNSVSTFTNGAGSVEVTAPLEAELRQRRTGGWYRKLVVHYLKKNAARAAGRRADGVVDGATASAQARSAIRWACLKSVLSGAAAGAVSTGATIFTAETEGLGGIIAGPVAALAIGAEMIFRAVVHIELSCELAAIFDVELDPDDEDDLFRVYALAFVVSEHASESEDPGQRLVSEVTHLEGEEVGEKVGRQLLGESVMRNIVPVVGIVASAVTNYIATRELGDTMRRYMRYHHALDTESAHAAVVCHAHLDLLIEGMWFIFSADGQLTPEEAGFLAHMLRKLSPLERRAVIARFVEDELDWTVRIKTEVPEGIRDAFMHTLEVAAAVDKEVGLPERKILRRAARSLGREFSEERVKRMIAEFEATGVLATPPAGSPSPGSPARA